LKRSRGAKGSTGSCHRPVATKNIRHYGFGRPEPAFDLHLRRDILSRQLEGKPVDIVSVFEAVGQHANQKISDKELMSWSLCIPGPGSARHVHRQHHGIRLEALA